MATEKGFFGATKSEIARFKREVAADQGRKSKPARRKRKRSKR